MKIKLIKAGKQLKAGLYLRYFAGYTLDDNLQRTGRLHKGKSTLYLYGKSKLTEVAGSRIPFMWARNLTTGRVDKAFVSSHLSRIGTGISVIVVPYSEKAKRYFDNMTPEELMQYAAINLNKPGQ